MIFLVAIYGMIWTICFIQIGIEIEKIRKIMEKVVKKDDW